MRCTKYVTDRPEAENFFTKRRLAKNQPPTHPPAPPSRARSFTRTPLGHHESASRSPGDVRADVDDDDAHGVDRLPDAENAARAMDEIVADSDDDGDDTDDDVPDQPDDDYESDGDDQEWALGFCERAPSETLQRQFFPSKVGGRPAWLDPVDVPTAAQLKCLYTREPLDFLLQVYASVDDDPPRSTAPSSSSSPRTAGTFTGRAPCERFDRSSRESTHSTPTSRASRGTRFRSSRTRNTRRTN